MSLWDRLGERFDALVEDLGGDTELRRIVAEARARLTAGEYSAAEQLLAGAMRAHGGAARVSALLGLSQLRQGKLAEARATLEEALAQRPDDLPSALRLGETLFKLGDTDAILSLCRRLLRQGVGDRALRARIHGMAGQAWLTRGDARRAVRELRKACAAAPSRDLQLIGLLGRALAQQRELGAARQQLEAAASAVPPDPAVLEALTRALLELGDAAEARLAALRWVEVDPQSGIAQELLATAALELGDAAAARDVLLRALEPVPGNPSLHRLLARVHAAVGDLAPALEQLGIARACASPAEQAEVLRESLRLRLTLADELRCAELATEARSLLALEPLDPLALAALAIAEADLEAEAARTLAARSLEAQGESYAGRLALGVTHAALGESAAALAEIRRALQLVPASRLARELLRGFRRERAGLNAQNQALELRPALARLERFCAAERSLEDLAPAVSHLSEEHDRPLLVAVMGEFNSGKSTFVNALIGETIAPMGVTPTTATINVLKYGRERAARVVWRDDREQVVPWGELSGFLQGLEGAQARQVRFVELLYPAEELLRVNVVDTPGLNAIVAEHEATARELLVRADAVIWLFSAGQAGKESEARALEWIGRLKLKTVGVLNKVDRLDEHELSALTAHVQASFGALLEVVCPVSAREALLALQENQPERLQASRFAELRAVLESQLFARSRALKHEVTRQRAQDLVVSARARIDEWLGGASCLSSALARFAATEGARFSAFARHERGELLRLAESVYRQASADVLDFVRPRRWALGEHQSEPADRDFLIDLLEHEFALVCAASRERVDLSLRELERTWSGLPGAPGGLPQRDLAEVLESRRVLLEAQVYGRFRAFLRGFLWGGWVDRFFEQRLPRLELAAESIYEAFVADPIGLDAELLAPLDAWANATDTTLQSVVRNMLDELALARWEAQACVREPLEELARAFKGRPDSAIG